MSEEEFERIEKEKERLKLVKEIVTKSNSVVLRYDIWETFGDCYENIIIPEKVKK